MPEKPEGFPCGELIRRLGAADLLQRSLLGWPRPDEEIPRLFQSHHAADEDIHFAVERCEFASNNSDFCQRASKLELEHLYVEWSSCSVAGTQLETSNLMYKNTNSASRIHALLTKAMEQGDKSLFAVLASIFQIKGADEAETAMQVLPRLNWFYAELQSLEEQARASKLSTHLYDHAFARIRMVFSPMQLVAGWHGIRGNLTSDVLLALAFLNEMLPSEEIAIPPEELEAIATELEQTKLLALNSDLPIALRRFIQHQLELIELALAQYPVYGAKALREAGHAAIGEIIGTQGTVEAPTENPEALARLGQLWKKFNTATDVALKVEKVGQLGHRTLEALSNWLQ